MFKDVRALSFDCYGTLIDWQSGLLHAVRPVLRDAGVARTDSEIVAEFARLEREAERGVGSDYQSYKDVQRAVMRGLLRGRGVGGASDDVLWKSIGDWPAFSDTPDALRRLQTRFLICIASNIDDDLFAMTQPKLGIVPDHVITAQQVRSYKPGSAHFDELRRRTGLTAAQIVHVGESRFHDIEPAEAIGFRTVWVNRQGGGVSASGGGERGGGTPTLTVRSLKELADRLVGTMA